MSSTLTKASVVGGAVLYLFSYFGSSGKGEILVSTLSILVFGVFVLLSLLPAAILHFIWRRVSVRRGSALAFPVIIFLISGGCVFLTIIGPNDFSGAAYPSLVIGAWLASIARALTYVSFSDLIDDREIA